jgi:hypothetical protein
MTEKEVSKNYEFYINSDLNEYAGKWIAIIDEKIVVIGDRADDVIREVKEKCPDTKFLLSKVPEPGLLVLSDGI